MIIARDSFPLRFIIQKRFKGRKGDVGGFDRETPLTFPA
jgi:hypothetical protein